MRLARLNYLLCNYMSYSATTAIANAFCSHGMYMKHITHASGAQPAPFSSSRPSAFAAPASLTQQPEDHIKASIMNSRDINSKRSSSVLKNNVRPSKFCHERKSQSSSALERIGTPIICCRISGMTSVSASGKAADPCKRYMDKRSVNPIAKQTGKLITTADTRSGTTVDTRSETALLQQHRNIDMQDCAAAATSTCNHAPHIQTHDT